MGPTSIWVVMGPCLNDEHSAYFLMISTLIVKVHAATGFKNGSYRIQKWLPHLKRTNDMLEMSILD